ncbi:MAG: hypothetical protein HGN29_09025 [Asgard group archaeon]|nr:hypothetical protein [Asgard group archaeon]
MNRKNVFLGIFIMGFLVSSIIAADLSKAIVTSDKLELKVGNSVEGKLLYTNASVTDELMSYPSLIVEDIFTLTDVSLDVVQIKYELEIPATGTDPLDMGEIDDFEMTQLILADNRTTILPAARLYFGNTTDNYEISLLDYTTADDLFNFNNTKITFANGSSYIWGDYADTVSLADELGGLMFIYLLLNFGLAELWTYTLLGISPTANVGDNINYYNADANSLDLGEVIDKPAVTTSDGDSYDTIHVKYEYNSVFSFWDAPEVHAYYEASTGLLIRMIEKDGIEQYEFVPGTVNIGGIGFTPYSTLGIIVSLVTVGILVLYIRKRK